MKDHPQYDYHVFTKLDFSDAKTRPMLENYWTGLQEGMMVDGDKVACVNYFK